MLHNSQKTTDLHNAKLRHFQNKVKIYFKTYVDILTQFCSQSSIHGLRYIASENRRLTDRIWWIIAFVLSAYLCGNLIHNLWVKWTEVPVIISYSHYLESISAIPFPAMTICPLAKVSVNKFNYTQAYRTFLKLDGNNTQNITDEELKKLQAVAQICDDFFVQDILKKSTENDTDDSFIDSIIDIAPGFEENIVACYMMGTLSTCYKYFHDILTEEGICFAFNLLSPSEVTTQSTASELIKLTQNQKAKHWHIDTGYEPLTHTQFMDVFPYRMFTTGKLASFKVILKVVRSNIDHLCTGPTQGFKVAFHASYEVPQLWKKHFFVAPRQSANIFVNPVVVVASEGLRSYRPEVRQCFFRSERSLKYFRIYTQQNCELECISNYTLSKCGCVQFAMPRNSEIKICGAARVQCCTEAENNVIHRNILKLCNCMPSCNSISYDTTMSEVSYHLEEALQRSALRGHIDLDNSTFSRISVSFSDTHFRIIKRSELQSVSGFLATCGGLFGLFMGASVLSIIEIFYYFTFHASFAYKQQVKQCKKSVSSKKLVNEITKR